MTVAEALEIVLEIAKKHGYTPNDIEACKIVEDLIVNEYGDD